MKRSVAIAVSANLLFGVIPVYWKLLAGVSNMYILGHRMLWSILFTVLFAAIDHKLPLLKQAFRNKRALGFSLLSFLIAIPLGLIAGLKKNQWPDQVISFFSYIGISIPSF